MKISVTFRNGEGDNWHKEYVNNKLEKLKKYIDAPVEARVILGVEKFRHVVEINLIANGLNVNTKEEEKEMHLAIDNAVEKIERQLKKRKEKTRDHKATGNRIEDVPTDTTATEEMEGMEDTLDTRLVETRKMALRPMSLDDAIFEITTTKNRFIIYRDSNSSNVNVLYRRDDGKYSLIETNY